MCSWAVLVASTDIRDEDLAMSDPWESRVNVDLSACQLLSPRWQLTADGDYSREATVATVSDSAHVLVMS